jgi:hypothetical protein
MNTEMRNKAWGEVNEVHNAADRHAAACAMNRQMILNCHL